MGLLEGYRADRLLGRVLTADSVNSSLVNESLTKLRRLAPTAIPQLIERLDTDETDQREFVETLLSRVLDDRTVEHFYTGLTSTRPRIVKSVVRVLSRSGRYNPNKLLDLLTDPAVPTASLNEILAAQGGRVDVNGLLRRAAELDSADQAAVLKVVGEIADASAAPRLIECLHDSNDVVRMHVVRILTQFDVPEVHRELAALLTDRNKTVRRTALGGIASMNAPVDKRLLGRLLADPDLAIQELAIDALASRPDRETFTLVMELLQDESDYVRRGAVEVLNEIADGDVMHELVTAIRDQDWWVRERAGDALARIGGRKVVEAMLGLIKSEDEFVRRTAVEVINANRDSRAYEYLVEALGDADWWVKERAIDALGGLGDTKATRPLLRVIEEDRDARGAAIRALGTLGDPRVIPSLVRFIEDPDELIQREVVRALETLTDAAHQDTAEEALGRARQKGSETVRSAADAALESLRMRLAPEIMSLEAAASSAEMGGKRAGDSNQTVDITRIEAGEVLADRYRYVKQIGRGAFGTVLLFEDVMVGEKIVLKFLNPRFSVDGGLLKRFVEELRYARKVTHRNMIRIYDLLTFGRVSAISMEYFPSHTLANELSAGEPLASQRALHVAREISFGMQAAHEAQVVHRDLKPGNVLIDDAGAVKVVDFGIAAAARGGHAGDTQHQGGVLGTPRYMAPEQVLGKRVTPATDIYSLGVILYEMLSGRAPYTGDDARAIMRQHIHGKAVPLSYVTSAVSSELSEVVRRAMAVDPEDRYRSMAELRQDIDPFLDQ